MRLQMIADSATAILSARTLDGLRAAISATCELVFPNDLVELAIYDDSTGTIHRVTGNGSAAAPTALSQTHYEVVAREARTVLVAASEQSQNSALAPIREGRRVLGFLTLRRAPSGAYDAEDVTALEVCAALASSALTAIRHIEQARSAEQSQRAGLPLSGLLQIISEVANRVPSFDAAARMCLAAICDHTAWPLGRVWRRNDEGELVVRSSHDANAGHATFATLPAQIVNLVARVAQRARPEWVQDARTAHESEGDAAGAFAFPVLVRNEVEAVLEFLSPQPMRRDPMLEELAVQLGAQLAHVLERERTDERIRFQARILESVGQAVVASDAHHRVVYWNRAAEDLYGWTRAEAIGRTDSEVLQARASAEQTAEITARLAAGQSWEAEFTVRRKDGTAIPVRIMGAVLYDSGGATIGFIGVATDLRRTREREHHARQMQKMEAVGRLAGGVAHDFNNLLTSIKGITHFLLEDLPSENPIRADLDEIRRAADRAASITKQLLAFSQRQVLQPRMIDLNALVRDLERSLQLIAGADTRIETDLEPEIGQVRVDPAQLGNVIAGLVANAREAMPNGGQIVLRTRNLELSLREVRRIAANARPGRYSVLEVEDNGIGIAPHQLEHIFEPFFTAKASGSGVGLGLSMAYGVVTQSDGYITAESMRGRGSTFRIYLPTVQGLVAHVAEVLDTETPSGAETVLLVEDEETVRKLARKILVRHGYEVLEAANGAEALEIWLRQPNRIDLVVTDVVMPTMGGAELIRRLRAARPNTPVLLMSGYTDDAIVRQSIASAQDWFLEKPFTPDALARKVRAVLDAPAESDS
jgi:PAS domain S-box-containing protein